MKTVERGELAADDQEDLIVNEAVDTTDGGGSAEQPVSTEIYDARRKAVIDKLKAIIESSAGHPVPSPSIEHHANETEEAKEILNEVLLRRSRLSGIKSESFDDNTFDEIKINRNDEFKAYIKILSACRAELEFRENVEYQRLGDIARAIKELARPVDEQVFQLLEIAGFHRRVGEPGCPPPEAFLHHPLRLEFEAVLRSAEGACSDNQEQCRRLRTEIPAIEETLDRLRNKLLA